MPCCRPAWKAGVEGTTFSGEGGANKQCSVAAAAPADDDSDKTKKTRTLLVVSALTKAKFDGLMKCSVKTSFLDQVEATVEFIMEAASEPPLTFTQLIRLFTETSVSRKLYHITGDIRARIEGTFNQLLEEYKANKTIEFKEKDGKDRNFGFELFLKVFAIFRQVAVAYRRVRPDSEFDDEKPLAFNFNVLWRFVEEQLPIVAGKGRKIAGPLSGLKMHPLQTVATELFQRTAPGDPEGARKGLAEQRSIADSRTKRQPKPSGPDHPNPKKIKAAENYARKHLKSKGPSSRRRKVRTTTPRETVAASLRHKPSSSSCSGPTSEVAPAPDSSPPSTPTSGTVSLVVGVVVGDIQDASSTTQGSRTTRSNDESSAVVPALRSLPSQREANKDWQRLVPLLLLLLPPILLLLQYLRLVAMEEDEDEKKRNEDMRFGRSRLDGRRRWGDSEPFHPKQHRQQDSDVGLSRRNELGSYCCHRRMEVVEVDEWEMSETEGNVL